MGAVPKRKLSTYRGGKREAAKKLKKQKQYACPKCNKPSLRHRVCPHCGFYKGKAEVIQSKTSQ